MGQENLAGYLGSSENAVIIQDLSGAQGSTSKVAHSYSWQHGARCWWEASVPLHMGLSTALLGCPHMMAGLPQSSLSKRAKQKLQCPLWLSLEIVHCHFSTSWWTHRLPSFSVRRDYKKAQISKGKDHWGSSWRLATILLLPLYLWWAEEWFSKDSRF